MRIGIDGSCLANQRGFGRFTRGIVQALADREHRHAMTIVLDRLTAESADISDRMSTHVVDLPRQSIERAKADGRRKVSDMLAMSWAVTWKHFDLFYFPTTYSYFPIWNTRTQVATIHDVLPSLHPELVFPTQEGRWLWAIKERHAIHRASRIVTVSQHSRSDLCSFYQLDPDRIDVIAEGVDPRFQPNDDLESDHSILSKYQISYFYPYILYVGGLSPHKNLLRLVQAFARSGLAREQFGGYQLILVGDHADSFHTNVEQIRSLVGELDLARSVKLPGFIPDAELAAIYRRSAFLVQPSILEGFGLPPLEAMSCGRPVACSKTGSLPEVVGEAGLYFDPLDVREIASVLRSLGTQVELREEFARHALDQSKRWTWSRAAEDLLAVFDRCEPTSSTKRSHRPHFFVAKRHQRNANPQSHASCDQA